MALGLFFSADQLVGRLISLASQLSHEPDSLLMRPPPQRSSPFLSLQSGRLNLQRAHVFAHLSHTAQLHTNYSPLHSRVILTKKALLLCNPTSLPRKRRRTASRLRSRC
jgi:hypothetical protein